MVKAYGRAAYLVSRGEGAVRGQEVHLITAGQGCLSLQVESREGMSGVQLTFKENPPRRITEMGKGMPTEMGEQEAPWRWTSRRPRAEGWAHRPVRVASPRPREVLSGPSENNDSDKTFP